MLKIYSQGCVAIKGTAGICNRSTDAKNRDYFYKKPDPAVLDPIEQ